MQILYPWVFILKWWSQTCILNFYTFSFTFRLTTDEIQILVVAILPHQQASVLHKPPQVQHNTFPHPLPLFPVSSISLSSVRFLFFSPGGGACLSQQLFTHFIQVRFGDCTVVDMEDIQKLLHIFCGGEFCNFSLVPMQRMTNKIKVDPACSP